MSLSVINLSRTLKSNIIALITIHAKLSKLIFLLTRINLINFINVLIRISITFYFYLVLSLLKLSNLIIKSIVTLL